MSVVFDHVDITVGDIEASRAFYARAFGEPTADREWVEWGDFGILGQFLQSFLRKIDPGFAFRETADIQFHNQTIFIGRSQFSAQDIAISLFEFIGRSDRANQPAQAQAQPN